MIRHFLGSCLMLLLAVACTPAPAHPVAVTQVYYPPEATPYYFLSVAQPTPTSTPFLPGPSRTPGPTAVAAAATPTPRYSPTPPPTPTPTFTPIPPRPTTAAYPPPLIYPISTQIPYPADPLPQPPGQVNILLLGSDQRNGPSFRTDTIILVTLNPDLDYANITSFPRDLYVYIPGWTMQRLNTAMAHGGFEALQMTMEYNFGFRPDHYIMINFRGFKEVVDSLGGVDVQVSQRLTDWRTGYGWYTVHPGVVHMDGEMALWYVRSRKTSSDIDRLRRAQEVSLAIGEKMLANGLFNSADALYGSYRNNVQTDLGLSDIIALIPMTRARLEDRNIRRYALDYTTVYDWTDPYTGAMVLLPRPERIRSIMEQALNIR